MKTVVNPHMISTIGDFKLFHINGLEAKAIGAVTGLPITDYPENIAIKSVDTSNRMLLGKGDYTFMFYIVSTITTDHSLEILLPR